MKVLSFINFFLDGTYLFPLLGKCILPADTISKAFSGGESILMELAR